MDKQIIKKWSVIGFLDGLDEIQKSNVARSMEYIADILINRKLKPSDFETLIFPAIRIIVMKSSKPLSNKKINDISDGILNEFTNWWETKRLNFIKKTVKEAFCTVDINAEILNEFTYNYEKK